MPTPDAALIAIAALTPDAVAIALDLTDQGYTVMAVDPNPARLAMIRRRELPCDDPTLYPAFLRAWRGDKLIPALYRGRPDWRVLSEADVVIW